MIEIHDHISSSFNNELSFLDDSLIEMGSYLEKMFEETLIAINDKDEALAKKVILSDDKIDNLETSVISQIQTLIAKRQPVGVDLRVLVGCTRIAGYMERIGDLLSSICKRAIILIEHSVEKQELIKLSSAVNQLFKLSLSAFAKKDFILAEKVRNEDVDVDKIYKVFFNTLLDKMSKDAKLAVPGTHMLFISKNFERIGDHATNIAESISYMASGEINPPPRPKIN